jgi:hypothetical protein
MAPQRPHTLILKDLRTRRKAVKSWPNQCLLCHCKLPLTI